MVRTSLTVALPYSAALIEHPGTIEEAVNRLLVILPDAEQQKIKAMAKDDLVLLHFSLGKDIRNSFGLNTSNTTLLSDRCADDVAMEIIEAVWERL